MSAHILIVDDEAALREFLREILWSEGYQSAEAADGVEALERVAEHRPDLVILDLLMPRLNGFEVAARLRSEHPTLSLLIISASHDGQRLAAGLGYSEFLPKPFELDGLLTSIARLLGL